MGILLKQVKSHNDIHSIKTSEYPYLIGPGRDILTYIPSKRQDTLILSDQDAIFVLSTNLELDSHVKTCQNERRIDSEQPTLA